MGLSSHMDNFGDQPNKMLYGDAAPTAGNGPFSVGDRIRITDSAAAGKYTEMVCVAGGDPGTWLPVDSSISGSPIRATTAAAVTATVNDGTLLVDTTIGNTTVTLPDSTTCKGKEINVVRTTAGTNTLTVQDGAGSPANINGSSSHSVGTTQWTSVIYKSTGAQWIIKSVS